VRIGLFQANLLERTEKRDVENCLAALAAQYQLGPEDVAKLREPLLKVADTKLKEFWQKRSAFTAVASVTGSVAAVAIGLAIGSLAPASLGVIGVGALVGLGGALFAIYRRLNQAVEAVAEAELEEMGKKEKGHGFLDRLVSGIVDGLVERFHKKYDLTPERIGELAKVLEHTGEIKKAELWLGRAKIEIGASAAVPLATAAAALAAGLLTPVGLVTAVAGAVIGGLVTMGSYYKKLEYSLEGTARSVIERWRKDGELTRPWTPRPLDQLAQARANRVVEQYAREFHLEGAARDELQRQVDLVRASKVKELWQDRPRTAATMPIAHAAMTGAIIGATGLAEPIVLVSLLVHAGLAALRELLTLDVELTYALEGTAYAAAKRLGRPPAYPGISTAAENET
jgi:predicted transcriptional regulator